MSKESKNKLGIKYHIVSQYEVPLKEIPAGLRAYHKPNTRDIYLVKGNYAEYDKLHEEYHCIKNHPDYPRDVKDFVAHEIEANLYSFSKIGTPRHIDFAIRYWIEDTTSHYKIGVAEALQVIGKTLNKYTIPQSWQDDFNDIMKEGYIGRQIPQYQQEILPKIERVKSTKPRRKVKRSASTKIIGIR